MPARQAVDQPYELKEEEPQKKRELPKAVPEDVRAVVKDFRRIIQDASPMLKNYLKMAKLSVGNQGQLLIVMPDALGAAVVGKPEHTEEINSLIGERTGRDVQIEVRHMEEGQRFEENYVDLEQIVRTEIIVEE